MGDEKRKVFSGSGADYESTSTTIASKTEIVTESSFKGDDDVMVGVVGSDIVIDGGSIVEVENSAGVQETEMESVTTEAAESVVVTEEVKTTVVETRVSTAEVEILETEAAESLVEEVQRSDTQDSSEKGKDFVGEVEKNIVESEVGVVSSEEPQCEVENSVDVPGSPGLNRETDDDSGKKLVEGDEKKEDLSSNLQIPVVDDVSLKRDDQISTNESTDAKSQTENGEEKLENVVKEVEMDQDLKNEESLDRGLDMEIDEQMVVNVEEVGQQQHDERELGTNSQSHGEIISDSANPISPTTQILDEGEVSEVDYRDLSNSEFDIISHIDFDEMLYCSGNATAQDSHTDSELTIKGEEIASIDNKIDPNSNLELPVTAGKDQVTNNSEDPMDLTVAENMDIDQEVTLLGGQDTDAQEQLNVKSAEDLTPAGAQNIPEGQDLEIDELDIDMEDEKNEEEKVIKQTAPKSESLVEAPRARYQLPIEDEGEFSVSDLVWGKVRSHPWWPGQIFDPSDASEQAMKYHKKDSFLVAYFGDQSFAWNEAPLLKHFKSNFSSMQSHSNSESFENAVSCALEELSRRIMLGLVCPCIPDDVYDNIKFQIVKNAGIEEESSKRDDRDKSTAADSFAPDKLLDYIKALAESPSGGADQLELVTAKAQLLAYYHSKGCYELPEFVVCGDLLENNTDASYTEEKLQPCPPLYQDPSHRNSYHRRKHNLKAGLYPSKKQKNLSDLMVDPMDFSDGEDGNAVGKLVSPSSGKKRNVVNDSKTISLAKVSLSSPNNNNVKPSFKIGDCIRRAASQMTSSPSIIKANNETDGDEIEGGLEYSSLDELLSRLHQAALDPKNEKNSSNNVIISFFSDFRNSLVADLHPGRELLVGKRKMAPDAPEFEFDDKSDTYWTDRIIHNGSEEQPPRKNRRRENHHVAVDSEKSSQATRRPRKRYSDSLAVEKIDPKAPAELVMNFSEVHAVPSETKLNRMFRHFGPIKESQTEVDREGGRARLVFRRCSDAEVAYNSAAKFNIFGTILVNYQLNHTITENFKPLSMSIPHGEEYGALYLEC